MDHDNSPHSSASRQLTPLNGGLAEHTLHGEIVSVPFSNPDSGYSVLQIRDPQGVIHFVVGSISGAYPGQSVEVTGKWEMHKEFGRQLRAEKCVFTLPATKEGIVRYLSSGLVKGIGQKYAQSIVDTFGEQTLYILDHASGRLKEVPGLGKKRIDCIRSAWKAAGEQRNLQIYMQSLGISQAYYTRIFKLYGDQSAEILKNNPYRLASEVKGIGFLLADRIASAAGIQHNDPKRLIAGVSYALGQARAAGHVCMPRQDFVPFLAGLLSVPDENAEGALAEAESIHRAAEIVSQDGDRMIYDPKLLACENELPRRLLRLAVQKKHFGQTLAGFSAPSNSKFSDEQLAAVRRISDFPVTIITGGPGVGKTTVVSEVVRRAKLAGLKTVLAAPTGRAAKRLGETTGLQASTIHRLLKWDPTSGQFYHDQHNPLNYQLYVIDETSMLDILIAVALFRAIPPCATVVLVGDPDQLPSVGPGNVLNDLIESDCFPVTRLTKIFRQGGGSGIIRAAHSVNQGQLPALPDPDKNSQSDFYWIQKEDPEEVASIIERLISERIPHRFGLDPLHDIQLLCPMNRGAAGTQAMNERLQKLLNPGPAPAFKFGDRTFRVGDKVMQIANNYEKNVFNGDMGFIQQVNRGDRVFTVRFDEAEVVFSFDDADQLVPAFAVTVHKAQGSEFPAVVMPILSQHYMMLQRNLLYTGMTRAKRLMILVGPEKAVSMAVRNVVREPRYTLLREKLIALFHGGRAT